MTKLTWYQCHDEWGLPGYCTQVGDDLVVASVVKDVSTGKPRLLDLAVYDDRQYDWFHHFPTPFLRDHASRRDTIPLPSIVLGFREAAPTVAEPYVLEYVRQEVDRLQGQLVALWAILYPTEGV
jgi:hypothetical protein